MNKVLLNTGAWVAIEDGGDSRHEPALRFKDAMTGQYLLFVMKQMGITEVFGFDRHFDQMDCIRSPRA